MSQNPIILEATTDAIPEGQIGEMTSEPPQEDEAGGREVKLRLARCGRCGATGYIYYDTENYRAYKCNNCCTVSFGCG